MDRERGEGRGGGRERERSRREKEAQVGWGEKTASNWCRCLRSLIFC